MELNCYQCKGHCNKKGYPSALKYSAYCDSQRGIKKEKTGVSRMRKIRNWMMGIKS